MPFDLNEHHRLKTCWFKYERIIKNLNRRKYFIVKNMLENKEASCLEEAENDFKKEVKTLDDERRKEMKKIQKEVRAEKKIEQAKEKVQEEMRKEALSAKREALRLKREQNKAEQANAPVRRSRRLAKKDSSSPCSLYLVNK